MNFIDKICNENNITYSVIAGTMKLSQVFRVTNVEF